MLIQKNTLSSSIEGPRSAPIEKIDQEKEGGSSVTSNKVKTTFSEALVSLNQGFCSLINSISSLAKRGTSPLVRDPALTVNRLKNGFTYYVRKNNYPYKGKGDFHLVVKTGMINESEKELGIAHLIEHITTVETASYPKDQIRDYLNSKGVSWGRDQNAYTSPEETVYTVSIPLGDAEILEKTLSILSEVASKATLSDEVIENERKIVIDELQWRNTAKSRLFKASGKLLFQGTPYTAICKPADQEIRSIKTCPADTIRSFYKRWYQPENMALIAVGDFDPKRVSELIEKHFASIPTSNSKNLEKEFKLKENCALRILSFADPELIKSEIEILYQLPRANPNGKVDRKEKENLLKLDFISFVLDQRLKGKTEEQNGAMIEAQSSIYPIIPKQPGFQISVQAYGEQLARATKELFLEIKRMEQHGVLPGEFELAKKTIREAIDHLIKEKGARSSSLLIERFKSHFLHNSSIADVDAEYELIRKLIEEIDLQAVNEMIPQILAKSPCLVSLSTPKKGKAPPLDAKTIKEWIDETAKQTVEPPIHETIETTLIKDPPAPEALGEPHLHKTINVAEYTLKNGLRLLIKPTDSKKDEVSLLAYSRKGIRTASAKELPAARFSTAFFQGCGLGDYDGNRLSKLLQTKQISYESGIVDHSAWCSGLATLQELETLFQMIHLQFTHPRYEREAFEKALKKKEEELRKLATHPDFLMAKTYRSMNTQNHPEFKPLTLDDLPQIDYETCKNFHQKIFSNPGDFRLFIVGNVQIEKIKELAERYLATIPNPKTGNIKGAFDLNNGSSLYSPVPPPPGIVRKVVEGTADSNAITILTFPAPINDSIEENRLSSWCCDLLTSRLNKTLRFEMGATYIQDCQFDSHGTRGLNPHIPSKTRVFFTGAPENLPSLEKRALDQIRDLQENGPSESEIDDLKAQISHKYADMIQTNQGWMKILQWNCELNSDQTNFTAMPPENVPFITKFHLRDHFKKIFPLNQYTVLTQLPKRG